MVPPKRSVPVILALPLLILLGGACQTEDRSEPGVPTATLEGVTSLLGESLSSEGAFDEATLSRLNADLDTARTDFAAEPSADNYIWLGRRTAYLWRYHEAIDIYTDAIARFPEDPRLYRHRGHRYISVRNLDAAIRDLQRAARLMDGTEDEVEPDGAPNAFNVPTSTLHFNVWYHLGLAHYLKGDFSEALEAYRHCMTVSDNDDSVVATTDWLYMTLRRLRLDDEAEAALQPISVNMNLLENHSYHRRLLMYKGDLPVDSLLSPAGASALDLATQGYGVGNWYLYNGDSARAASVFEEITSGSYWPAFGYIAAEAELARLGTASD